MLTQIALIILLNLIVFFRTLSYGMVIDDNCRTFHKNDIAKNWLKRLFQNSRYSGYGGLPLPVDHLFTTLLHTAVCVVVYKAFGSNQVSFATALLFSVHPVNNQVSIWLNGKRFAVVALLTLLMWATRPLGLFFYLLSPVWHFGGFPAILLGVHTPWVWVLWLLPIIAIVFHKKIINKIGSRWERIPHGEIKRIHPKKFIILFKMFGYTFWHCLFPRRMSFYHMFMERFGFSDEDNKYWYSLNKDFWVGLVTLIGVICCTALNWNTPLGFGLYWYVIFISMWLQFPLGFTQAISERVYYLPNIGLMYALSYALRDYPYVLVAVFVYYLTKLYNYMPAYKNINEFYRYALNEFPDQFRARAHVVQRNLQENRIFFCLRDCGIGLKLNPSDNTLNLLMCQSLMSLGAWGKAEEYLNTARKTIIPGQEKTIARTIDSFQVIINKMKSDPNTVLKQIKPDREVIIKPEQIVKE